jgi:hypothetical protein
MQALRQKNDLALKITSSFVGGNIYFDPLKAMQ